MLLLYFVHNYNICFVYILYFLSGVQRIKTVPVLLVIMYHCHHDKLCMVTYLVVRYYLIVIVFLVSKDHSIVFQVAMNDAIVFQVEGPLHCLSGCHG